MKNYKDEMLLIMKGKKSWGEIHELLVKHNVAGITTEAGFFFEEFAYGYLITSGNYKKVWRLSEVPKEYMDQLNWKTRNDKGVDLVAIDLDGNLVVIQVKFKNEETKKLSFSGDKLSNLVRGRLADKCLIFTNARAADDESLSLHDNVGFVGNAMISEISERRIKSIIGVLEDQAPLKPIVKKQRKHQIEAISAIVGDGRAPEKCILEMACGTGKTATALWIKERLNSKLTLFVAPALQLIRQTKKAWKEDAKDHFKFMAVCSDKTIEGDDAIDFAMDVAEFDGKVSTDPGAIRSFLMSDGDKVVFSTYQSLPELIEALKGTSIEFDFAFMDEAHRCVGAQNGLFQAIHSNGIRVKSKIFMTATPKVFSNNVMKAVAEDFTGELEAYSMDNEEVFGKSIYRLSLGEAIERDLLADYRLVAMGITDKDLADKFGERVYEKTTGKSIDEAAAFIAILKAMKATNSKKMISFHSLCKEALYTRNKLNETGEVEAFYVDGTMSSQTREAIFSDFKRAEKAVLLNANCLTEGVDIQAVDSIFFATPKASTISIIQALGRPLRKDDNNPNKIAHIILPIYTHIEEGVEIDKSIFSSMYRILAAVCEADHRVVAYIKELIEKKGAKGEVKLTEFVQFSSELVSLMDLNDLDESIFSTQILKKLAGIDSEEKIELLDALKLFGNEK